MLRIALVSVLLTACGTMPGFPGYLSESKSTFDGSHEIEVHPGHASGCCSLGARWNSRQPEFVQIVALIVSASGYTAIEGQAGLEFNIDGRMVQLDATRYPTQLEHSSGPGTMVFRKSSRSFLMRRSDFDAMLKATLLRVRLNTLNGALEGDLLRDAYGGAAIQGFQSFATKLPR